jgi:hypothetical protein
MPTDVSCSLFVSARDVLAACNTGFDRDEEVTRFDQVIEQVNSGIADGCR